MAPTKKRAAAKKAASTILSGETRRNLAQEARDKIDGEMLTALPAIYGTAAVKRPRGRPPTGRTPDKVRKAKSRASLVEAGGRELNTPLPPEQAAQLDAIKAHHGYDSDRTAVFALLALGAKRIKK
jgi:hypothetical protein